MALPRALPTDQSPATLLRYAALGEALLAQFPGRILQLDCGPTLGVHAVWQTGPTPAEATAFDSTVDGWDWTSPPDDQLELNAPQLKRRVQLALVVRASSAWAGLSAARKARVLAIIDDAAARVIAAL